MRAVRRILPYTRQLVWYALYDLLDQERGEYEKTADGCITARVTVYGNRSGFALSVSEEPPVTVLTVQMSEPCAGLSEQGELRAANHLADGVEQLLENELKIAVLTGSRGEEPT